MKFAVDESRKIAFGYSAKSGCSHIKRIYWYLTENSFDRELHIDPKEYMSIPDNYKQYTFILIVRNPYERLVSGFLDKYNSYPWGECRSFYKCDTITFDGFVDYVVRKECTEQKHVHHFCPQTDEFFNMEKLKNSKKLVVYDITNIDYKFIENLYKKKIPEKVINFRGPHSNKNTSVLEKEVFTLDICKYNTSKVPTKYFYNKQLIEKVKKFYKRDFEVFNLWNIHYPEPL